MVRDQIWAAGFSYFRHDKIQQALVEIVAAESGVAVGSQHLENAVVQFEYGEVKRAAAEIIHGDLRFLL